MENGFKSYLFILILFIANILIYERAVKAELFQGEVVSVDQNRGNVTVRTQTPDGRVQEERVFNLAPSQVVQTADPAAALSEVEIGDEVQVSAVNRGGTWLVETLITNPQMLQNARVLVAAPNVPGQRANAVLATSGNSTVIQTLVPQTQTVTAGGVTRIVPATTAAAVSGTAVTPVGTVSGATDLNLTSLQDAGLTPVPPSATGVSSLNSSFEGTTVGPIGVTTSGGSGATSSGIGTSSTNSGATGTPTRSGAEGSPARNGAQGASQSA